MHSESHEVTATIGASLSRTNTLLAARPDASDESKDRAESTAIDNHGKPATETVPATGSHRGTTHGGTRPRLNAKGRKVAIAAAVSLALAIAGGCWYAFSQQQSKPAVDSKSNAVVTVSTEKAQRLLLDDTFLVTGSVSALDPLSVGAEVSGLRITNVEAEEGDQVKRGQVLARLNSSVLQAKLDQAKARLESSQANLKKAIQPARPEDVLALKAALAQAQANIIQDEAGVRQAQATLFNARENAKRFAQLVGQGAVSKQDAETRQMTAETAAEALLAAEAKVKAARATAEQAKERLHVGIRGGRREDVLISQAALKEISGSIAELQAQIDQTVIRAPEDGLIAKREAHIGDVSTSGKPLFHLIRSNRLELRAQVSDIDLGKFKNGQQVMIRPTENDQRTAKGQVWLVSPQIDPVTRLGTVRVSLPTDSWLRPGMFVQGTVVLGQRPMVTVPLPAVVTQNGESVVFTLDGEQARSLPVKTGMRTQKLAEIVTGVSEGQEIIVKGAGFVADGDAVRVSR